MNSNSYIKGVQKIIEQLPLLKKTRDPHATAVIGFLFGPVGIGIYLESTLDFFWSLALLLGFGIVIPGLGLIPGWCFSAWFGYLRVLTSNEKALAEEQRRAMWYGNQQL